MTRTEHLKSRAIALAYEHEIAEARALIADLHNQLDRANAAAVRMGRLARPSMLRRAA